MLVLVLALGLLDDPRIVTASGESLSPRELSLSRESGELVATLVDASGVSKTIPAADIVEISFGAHGSPAARPNPEDVEIRLTTGDIVLGRLGPRHEEGVSLLNPLWGNPLVKFQQIRAVILAANRTYLPRRLPEKVDDADLVFTVAGDRASGTLIAVSSLGIVYKSAAFDREVTQALKDVAGLWLIETEAAPKEPSSLLASIQTSDGTSMRGDLQSLRDGVATFKDLYGQERKVARSALSSIHFKNGRVVYLSDLQPKAVDEEANLIRGIKKERSDLEYPFQRDRSAKGGKLLLGGVEHRKGLGVRAHSSISYAIDGGFKRFQAVVGLDATALHLGHVAVQVWVDGGKRADHVFKGSGETQILDVDVSGAKELRLLVTWPEKSNGQSDFADWGSARLIR